MTRSQRLQGDHGEGLIAPIVAMTVFLLLCAGALEFFVNDIGRARVQHTLARAVRAGAVQGGGAAACQETSDSTGLLGGSMRKSITIECTETPDRIIATATGEFEAWLPSSWPWRVDLRASAARQDR